MSSRTCEVREAPRLRVWPSAGRGVKDQLRPPHRPLPPQPWSAAPDCFAGDAGGLREKPLCTGPLCHQPRKPTARSLLLVRDVVLGRLTTAWGAEVCRDRRAAHVCVADGGWCSRIRSWVWPLPGALRVPAPPPRARTGGAWLSSSLTQVVPSGTSCRQEPGLRTPCPHYCPRNRKSDP